MIAPQLGLFGGAPPRTDNPAASRPGPPPPAVRELLQRQRAEFAGLCAQRRAALKKAGWA